jgi:hypothetical protein
VKRDGGEWKTDGGGPTSAVPVAKKNKKMGRAEREATKRQGSRGDHPRFFCDRFGRSYEMNKSIMLELQKNFYGVDFTRLGGKTPLARLPHFEIMKIFEKIKGMTRESAFVGF